MNDNDQRANTITRLANRTATLTLVSSFAFIVGIVAVPAALRETEDAVTRVAAASPISAALGTAALAYRARVQLRLARERDEAGDPSVSPPADGHGGATLKS